MSLLEQWRKLAYNTERTEEEAKIFYSKYTHNEKAIYDALLKIEKHPILDTFQNFAQKFNVDNMTMIGFLDGINDSLKTPNDIDNISEDTIITLDYDAETLYKNLREAKAKDIYELPIWDKILPYRNQEIQCIHTQPAHQINIPHCPTCGSTNIKPISATERAASIAGLGLFSKKINKNFKCKNCGYTW